MYSFSSYAFVAAALVTGVAQAQFSDAAEPATFWTVGVSALTDDESSHNLAVSFDVAPSERMWISALVGESRSPRSRADVSADTLAVGIDHRFGLVGLRAGLERWGDSGAIESDDSSLGLYFQTGRVKVELATEKRDIDITVTLPEIDGRAFSRKVPLSADGQSLTLRVDASERVRLRFGIEDYDYPAGLAALPRVDALNLLSASTLTLANSFVSEVLRAGVEIEIGNKVLGFGLSKDESAIDRSKLTSFDAALMIPVGRRIDLEISVGRSDSDLFETGIYGGLLLLIYGGG